jgi:hypothetical protein
VAARIRWVCSALWRWSCGGSAKSRPTSLPARSARRVHAHSDEVVGAGSVQMDGTIRPGLRGGGASSRSTPVKVTSRPALHTATVPASAEPNLAPSPICVRCNTQRLWPTPETADERNPGRRVCVVAVRAARAHRTGSVESRTWHSQQVDAPP